MNLLQRIQGFLVGLDEAANALGGGSYRRTISGTIGRACGFASGKPHWWGQPCRIVVDGLFCAEHCRRQAEREALIS